MDALRLLTAVVVTALSTAACAPSVPRNTATGGAQDPAASSAPTSAPGDVRLAVVGDSITDADSPDLAAGDLGPASWVSHAVGDGIAFAGGWARWGATTAEMAAAARPVDADVLVVLAGTNDMAAPDASTEENLLAVVERVGVYDVVLSAVPPIDPAPAAATRLNERLAALAEEEGWTFVDAPAGLRDGDRFAPGMATDGVHPSEAGARVLGEALRAAVLEAGG